MSRYDLPSDTENFLKRGKQLVYDEPNCEAGKVALKKYDELSLSEIYVDSEQSPIQNEDPHFGEAGYYVVRAVDLVSECLTYGAEGILVWLPDYKLFGTWDCDHWDILVFPEATWADIVANPALYLSAQWKPNLEIGNYLKPWPFCEFKLGRPF